MDEGDDQPRAGRPDGVSKRAGSTVDIDLCMVEIKVPHCGHGHDRERFIDLDPIHAIERQTAGTFERAPRGARVSATRSGRPQSLQLTPSRLITRA